MKLKNTLFLALILIALGAYVYFIEIKQYDEKKQTEETAKQVFNFAADSVESFTLKNNNGIFEIKKIQGEWRLTQPLYTGADQSAINSLLSSLENAKKETQFSIRPDELKNYGLDSRGIDVQLYFANGNSDSLRLGDKTPVDAFVFSVKTDTLVFTTGESVKNSLDKKLFDLRDKKLLHLKKDEVQSFTVRNAHGTLNFEKDGSGKWMFSNIQRPANATAINSLLSKLEFNNAKSFVDEEGTELEKYGLSRPQYQIDLLIGAERGRKQLLISKKMNDKFYARDDSRKPVFEVDSLLVKEVAKSQSDFRDTDFAEFDQSRVDRITIHYSDTLLTCVKDSGENWALLGDEVLPLKSSEINSFFSKLNYAVISEFVADGKINRAVYGFDKPSLRISLFDGEQPLLAATFGRTKGEKVFARTDKYESVFLLMKSKFNELKLRQDKIIAEKPVQTS